MKRCVFVMAGLLLIASRAGAQTGPDPWTTARIHIGVLAMTPTISLTNAGVDSNVFNEPDQAAPKRDFTVTVEPKADLWVRLGRSTVTGNVTEDLVYYKKYSSERTANATYKAGVIVPRTRFNFTGGVSYNRARDRPGFEIDARSQHTDVTYDGGVEFKLLSKTYVGVKGRRQNVDFDKAAVFLGSSLHDELTRKVTSEALTLRHAVTPLTSITIDVGKQQDRFQFNHLRDSDSTQIAVGFKFDPFALLKGAATVGYRDFKPLVAGLPGYKGSTAAVDLSYVALGTTKLGVQAARDVQYSYDVNQPYYLQTGFTASIAQQIFGPVDVVGRYGVQRLDYRDRVGAVVAASNRKDYVHSYGGGIGYHLGKDIRVGVNVDNSRRWSAVSSRTYSGLRYGTAVTYGS